MKLYKLTQETNNDHNTYDACIVCAESEEDAISITPNNRINIETCVEYGWVPKSEVLCVEIGIANDTQLRGVVLASFNAGLF